MPGFPLLAMLSTQEYNEIPVKNNEKSQKNTQSYKFESSTKPPRQPGIQGPRCWRKENQGEMSLLLRPIFFLGAVADSWL